MSGNDAETIKSIMMDIGAKGKASAQALATCSGSTKNAALKRIAELIRERVDPILEANAKDVTAAEAKGLKGAMVDRLRLDPKRVESIAAGVEAISKLDDPVGKVTESWEKSSNNLAFERVRVPIGVIGIVYESRPNVTVDAGALCIKSGNAAVLRGGSESFHSSTILHGCIADGLESAGLPRHAVQIVPVTDRAAVGHMLADMASFIDVIVPRGGKGLVKRIQEEAKVPVFSHLEGICHTYIDRSADVSVAAEVTTNAKMRRTGICGATETVLIDAAAVDSHLKAVITSLIDAGCKDIRGCDACRAADDRITTAATKEDYETEYLDAIVSIRAVDGVKGAIEHIAEFSSHHTEAIIAEDPTAVETFFKHVDSAILLHNASTQFADGGEFGFGAEIGIATGKLHARGPVGVEQLTTFKYLVRAKGKCSVRPK